jgi:hypothetical protein
MEKQLKGLKYVGHSKQKRRINSTSEVHQTSELGLGYIGASKNRSTYYINSTELRLKSVFG